MKMNNVNSMVIHKPSEEEAEKKSNTKSNDILDVLNDREVQLKHPHKKRFGFNKVFRPKSSQAAIYQSVVAPLVEKALSGYSCTLITYGQSGSGKTYTLLGDKSDYTKYGSEDSFDGCIPRALISILDEMKKLDKNTQCTVRVSYVELFNEELVDLLHDNLKPAEPLRIHEDPEQKGNMYIQNLFPYTVCDPADIERIFETAEENRKNSSVLENANQHSHKLFIVNIHTRTVNLPGDECLKYGKIVFVCVAGCENLRRNSKVPPVWRRGLLLNQSLVMLRNVVTAIKERKSYVPHSESKLTKILKEAFRGRSKTAIIATISPARSDVENTLATLNFARDAKTIKNLVEINKITTKSNIVNCLVADIEKLEKDLIALRSKTGFYVDAKNYTDVVTESKEKVNEINEKTKQIADMEKKIIELETKKLNMKMEWESLNKSFDLTKRTAILHKRKLLKRRVQAEKLKSTVEAAQIARLPVLEQNNELRSLVEIRTNQCKILESKTVSTEEKLLHNNNLLRQDLYEGVINKCTNLVQSVEEKEKNEITQRLITVCSNMENTVESLNTDTCRNVDEVSTSIAQLQTALKTTDANDHDMKLALEENITNFTTKCKEFFDDYNLAIEQLKKQLELLNNTTEETEEQYKNFCHEHLKSTDVLHSINNDLMASVEMQSNLWNGASETLTKFQENVAGSDNSKNAIETCCDIKHIKQNFQELIESYTKEKVSNVEMTNLFAKTQSHIERNAEQVAKGLAICTNLSSDIDDCVKMVKKENDEKPHPPVFDTNIDGSIFFENKMSEFENAFCFKRVAPKLDISTIDFHETLQTLHKDLLVPMSANFKQKISSKLNCFYECLSEVEAEKETMYSEITEKLKSLTNTVNGLLEEHFNDEDDAILPPLPPCDNDLLNEDSETSDEINQLLAKLEKLQSITDVFD